ncbi:MAG: DUF2752 domain-containing protein [Akkermansia sp.]|nr:DUF2752 domain-containing protein [Akkermansia sp.]
MSCFFAWLWRLAPPLLLLVLAAGMLWFPQQLSELVGTLSPGCIFRKLTGLECPGCGGTRALRALISGDIGAAMGYNPFIIAALPILLIEYLRSWWSYLHHADAPIARSRAYCILLQLFAAATILWFIGRNLV